jgi:undecaprenyl diphosphate synthase
VKSSTLSQPIQPEFDSSSQMPEHIAIIMDGNRRWARERGLPVLEGHRQGVKALRRTSEALRDFGIRYLTVFAFSTENKNRPLEEVSGLMRLICLSIKRELAEIHANGICLKFIGERETLGKDVRDMINHAEKLTADNTQFFMTVGLNYGSHNDIAVAAQKLALQVQAGEITAEQITPDLLGANLSTVGLPTPDILIRTSGEHRVSNFLLWEISYAELMFMDQYWPDFNKDSVERVLTQFQTRQRRYGR